MKMKTLALPLCSFALLLSASLAAQQSTTLQEIVADYAANAVAADSKYVNKPFSFSAKVGKIEKDSSGRYYVAPSVRLVRLYFNSDQADVLKELKKGDDILLHGVCKGYNRDRANNHLVFDECRMGLSDVPPQTAATLDKVKKSLVIVKGFDGSGSGFVASLGGVNWVVTNFHVFDDNKDIKLVDPDNKQIEWKSIKFAPDRDIALFELADQSAYTPIEIQKDVALTPVETPVRIYGNSLGQGVFTEIGGKVLGAGPTSLEVDAGFVSGNSGSPVLSFPELKVLGVATSASIRQSNWSMTGTRFAKVRRFATRIDDLDPASLETYEKARFDLEDKACQALEDAFLMRYSALCNMKGVNPAGDVHAPSWEAFLLLAGKLPDSGRKARLTTLITQWNKEMAGLSSEFAKAGNATSSNNGSSLAKSSSSSSQRNLGVSENNAPSVQKLPFDDLNRLLFQPDPKPKFSYKRLQTKADELALCSDELKTLFKEKYENIKALYKK